MTASWKAGDRAMVVVKSVHADGRDVMISRAGGGGDALWVDALHPLPPTMSAEDAAIIAAAKKMTRDYEAMIKVCGPGQHDQWTRARSVYHDSSYAVITTVHSTPHPICDHPTIYDTGFCCGQTPCTAGNAPDDLHAGGAEREAAVVDRADEEARRVVGLRDAVVEAALKWQPGSVVERDGSSQLLEAVAEYHAALTPPATPTEAVIALARTALSAHCVGTSLEKPLSEALAAYDAISEKV